MTIKLGSNVTIAQIGEIREALLRAFESEEPVELDTTAVTEVDVAGIQLFCAAHHSAAARGRSLQFAGGAPGEAITRAMVSAGFLRAPMDVERFPWTEAHHG